MSRQNYKKRPELTNYRPKFDTLEDRSLPGNTVLGIGGISLPFSVSGKKLTNLPAVNTRSSSSATPATTTDSSTVQKRIVDTRFASISKVMKAANADGQVRLPSVTLSAIPDYNPATLGNYNGNSSSVEQSSANALATLLTGTSRSTGQAGEVLGIWNGGSNSNVPPDSVLGGNTEGPNSVYDPNTVGPRNYDTRGPLLATLGRNVLTPTQQAAANAIAASIPGLNYTVNSGFGTPNAIINTKGFLTSAATGTAESITLNYLRNNAAFFGLSTADLNTIKLDYQHKWGTTNVSIAYFNQKVNGISVVDTQSNSAISATGQLAIFNNKLVPGLTASLNTAVPVISAADAIRTAALDSGVIITGNLNPLAAPVGTERAQTFINSSISVDPIPVKLQYLPITPGDTRLVWNLKIFIPNSAFYFDYNVDAVTGQAWNRSNYIAGDSYRVFAAPIRTPLDGGRTLVVNPADTLASPWGWHDTNGRTGAEYNITRGNNVNAKWGPLADPAGGDVSGTSPVGGINNVYDFPLDLGQDPSVYQRAATTNLFYWGNYYHDVLYRMGYNEVAGNYQQNNYGRGTGVGGVGGQGKDNDPMIMIAQSGSQRDPYDANNAYFVPSVDGQPGRVAMFIWDQTTPFRDGDLDSEIIVHELTHGTSTRLVGGANTVGELSATFEAAGLGEGWSDFYALALTPRPNETKTTNRTIGAYVLGQPANGPGIRNYPYSYDKFIAPYTYSYISPNQSGFDYPAGYSYYVMGELWANTLYDFLLNMKTTVGFTPNLLTGDSGNTRALRAVTLGMALTGSTPTGLDARNGVLAAEQLLFGGQYRPQLWDAFARRGMGILARPGTPNATNPRDLPPTGFFEDFTLPDDLTGGGGGGGGGGATLPSDGSKDSLYETNETANRAFDLGALTPATTTTIRDLAIAARPLTSVQDRDWFKFTTSAAGPLSVNAAVTFGAGDLDVRVYRSLDGTPNRLVEVGTGQGTKRVKSGSETVNIAVGNGQVYYVNILGFNKGQGNYNLNITST